MFSSSSCRKRIKSLITKFFRHPFRSNRKKLAEKSELLHIDNMKRKRQLGKDRISKKTQHDSIPRHASSNSTNRLHRNHEQSHETSHRTLKNNPTEPKERLQTNSNAMRASRVAMKEEQYTGPRKRMKGWTFDSPIEYQPERGQRQLRRRPPRPVGPVAMRPKESESQHLLPDILFAPHPRHKKHYHKPIRKHKYYKERCMDFYIDAVEKELMYSPTTVNMFFEELNNKYANKLVERYNPDFSLFSNKKTIGHNKCHASYLQLSDIEDVDYEIEGKFERLMETIDSMNRCTEANIAQIKQLEAMDL